jgi:hypothetical protein
MGFGLYQKSAADFLLLTEINENCNVYHSNLKWEESMRRGRDLKILENEQKGFVGFILGADFTAEHEWGIRELKDALGINSEITRKFCGLSSRTMTGYDKRYLHIEHGKEYSLLTFEQNNTWNEPRGLDDEELHPYKGDEFVCAWDGSSFGIVIAKEHKQMLEDLKAAFERNDIAVWIGGRSKNPFENPGLIVVIASMVSEENKKMMCDSDLDHLELMKAFKKTGIEELLKKAGKGYYALSPKWKNEEKKELVFWLNPHEQNKYDSNWFTLQNLIDWTHDKGPVIKTRKKQEE